MQWNPNQSALDCLETSQSDISITVKHSYSQPEQQGFSSTFESSGSGNFSFEVNFSHQHSNESSQLLKCFLLLLKISQLPLEALQESVEDLEQIVDFYSDYSPESLESYPTSEIISGKIVSTEVRPPLILSWD